MKRKIILSGVLFLGMYMVTQAQVTDPRSIDIQSGVAIKVDGDTSDWAGISSSPMDRFINMDGDTDPVESDLSADFKLAWDQYYCYVWVKVNDDVAGAANRSWKNDNVELFFNADLSNDDAEGAYKDGDIQLRFARVEGPPAGTIAVISNSTAFWTVEAMIPWSLIYGANLSVDVATDKAMGFDIKATDQDNAESTSDGANRDGFAGWNNDTGEDVTATDTRVFGTITLKGDGVPVDNEDPSAPANLQAVAELNTIGLTWEASTDNTIVVQYNVYDGSDNLIGASDHLSFTATGLQFETEYTFKVTAQDAAYNESTAATVTISTPAPPAGVPIVDGEVDELWNSIDPMPLEILHENYINDQIFSQPDKNDLDAYFKAKWDDTDFYLLVEVVDNIIYTDHSSSAQNDNVEIYFDLDNSKNVADAWNSSAYDGIDDEQLRVVPGGSELASNKRGAQNVIFAQSTTENGYLFEFKFPWAGLTAGEFTPEVGKVIGFDLLVGDNDNDNDAFPGKKDAILGWGIPYNDAWFDPSLIGSIKLGADGQVMKAVAADYSNSPVYKLNKKIKGEPGIVPEDISGSFQAAWNKWFYFIKVDVMDDSIYWEAEQANQNDNIELYFDINNSKEYAAASSSPSYDGFDDDQLRFNYGADSAVSKNREAKGIQFLFNETLNGYSFEARLPWHFLTDAGINFGSNTQDPLMMANEIIGFDIMIADNDGTAKKESIISWNSSANVAWYNVASFGNVEMREDGSCQVPLDIANTFAVTKVIKGDGITDAADFSASFKPYWDADTFRLMVNVVDDILYNGNEKSAQNDNVEVYFDLDNSKLWADTKNTSAYDGVDDDQFRFVYGQEDVTTARGAKGVTFTQWETDSGYVMDIKFPWDSLTTATFDAVPGAIFGFDVIIGDNDNEGEGKKDAILGWYAPQNTAWFDPSMFGVMQFEGIGTTKAVADETKPGKPANLSADADENTVTLAWDATTDDFGVLSYVIFADNQKIDTVDSRTLSYVLTDIEAGDHFYNVVATDIAGNISPKSDPAEVTIVGINHNDFSGFSLYPNPVFDVLNIKNAEQFGQISIHDLAGKELMRQVVSNTHEVISMQELVPGVYIIRLKALSGEIYSRKLIKK